MNANHNENGSNGFIESIGHDDYPKKHPTEAVKNNTAEAESYTQPLQKWPGVIPGPGHDCV